MFIPEKRFCVNLVTACTKKVLYAGMASNREQRMTEHYVQRGNSSSFTGKYYAFCLINFEYFDYVKDAIARGKEIKDLNRNRKETLATAFNSGWKFVNEELFGKWPPASLFHRKELYREDIPRL